MSLTAQRGAAYTPNWSLTNRLQANLAHATALLRAARSNRPELKAALSKLRRYWNEENIILWNHYLGQLDRLTAEGADVHHSASHALGALFVAFDEATDFNAQIDALAQIGLILTRILLEGWVNYGEPDRRLWPLLSIGELRADAAAALNAAYAAHLLGPTAYSRHLKSRIRQFNTEQCNQLTEAQLAGAASADDAPTVKQCEAAWAITLKAAIAADALAKDKKKHESATRDDEFLNEKVYIREKTNTLCANVRAVSLNSLAHSPFQPDMRLGQLSRGVLR